MGSIEVKKDLGGVSYIKYKGTSTPKSRKKNKVERQNKKKARQR